MRSTFLLLQIQPDQINGTFSTVNSEIIIAKLHILSNRKTETYFLVK